MNLRDRYIEERVENFRIGTKFTYVNYPERKSIRSIDSTKILYNPNGWDYLYDFKKNINSGRIKILEY